MQKEHLKQKGAGMSLKVSWPKRNQLNRTNKSKMTRRRVWFWKEGRVFNFHESGIAEDWWIKPNCSQGMKAGLESQWNTWRIHMPSHSVTPFFPEENWDSLFCLIYRGHVGREVLIFNTSTKINSFLPDYNKFLAMCKEYFKRHSTVEMPPDVIEIQINSQHGIFEKLS